MSQAWRFCIAGMLWPSAVGAQVSAEQALDIAHQKYSLAGCKRAAATDEIVVCGTSNAKYRLPLPVERPSFAEHVPGELAHTPVDALLNRECGVFQGQRRCGINELRSFGYGGGSVPLRALVMLGKKLVDPESELGPPGGKPFSPDELGK